MEKKLRTEIKRELYHYAEGMIVIGENPNMTGYCTGLSGDCTGLSGDIDICNITEKERKKGINIRKLIKEE